MGPAYWALIEAAPRELGGNENKNLISDNIPLT